MRNKVFFIFIFITSLYSKELEKVSIQLQWLNQFQFAGYYVAKEKGFYKDSGLDVDIKNFKFGINTTDEIINKKSTYATGRTSLVVDKSLGKDVILLASILQSSPLALVSKKSSNIQKLKDLIGKKVMISQGNLLSAELDAMLNSRNINMKYFMIDKSQDKVQLFKDNKVDVISIYTTNQLYDLDKSNIKYNLFRPKDFGFDFYSDILYTSQYEIANHRQRAIDFTKASIRGWEYAFSHIEEAVDLILHKYNSQNKTREALIYEAKELKKLAYYHTKKLGEIKNKKIQRIYDIYNVMGLVKNPIDINKFILHVNSAKKINFSKKEKNWIQNNPIIKYSTTDWKPLSIIKNGKMTGIIGSYLDLISKKTGLKFKLIPSTSPQEVLEKFKNKKIDIMPSVGYAPDEMSFGYVSNTYKKYPMVIVTTNKYKLIEDLSELNGKIVIVKKGHASYDFIKKNYPKIKLKTANTIKKALLEVDIGKADAFVGHIASSLFYISDLYLKSLKISGATYFEFHHKYFIQKDKPLLLLIINKALKSLTAEEKAKINAKWLSTTVEKKLNYTMILTALFIIIIIFFLFLYRHKELKSYNIELEKSNKLIKEKDIKLELLNDSLEDKINDATISLLSKNRDLEEAMNVSKKYELVINESNILSRSDLKGKITYVNSKFCEISGYSKEELIGKNHNIVRHEDTPSGIFKELWTTIRLKKIWHGILKNKSKNGEAYWVNMTIVPIMDDDKVVEYMAIRHDVTEVFDLHKEIEDTQREVIYKMGEVGESRSKETGNHVKRVAQYSKDLAILYGLDYKESEVLFTASPMHDIGKVGIPDEILKKPGKLTPDEFEIMKTHAQIGYNILKGSKREVLNTAVIVAREHHEKWDGSGYPRGLSGKEIHIYGRITALADVFDALGSKRYYKEAWGDDKIFSLFQEERGKHFDPKLVDLFMNNLEIFFKTREKYRD